MHVQFHGRQRFLLKHFRSASYVADPRLLLATIGVLTCISHVRAQTTSFDPQPVLQQYCYDCHDAGKASGELVLDDLDPANPTTHPDIWEKVIRKLRHRQMPPPGKPRPDESTYGTLTAYLEAPLDRAAREAPNPGRTDAMRRLSRNEYQNAIRDVLALDVDATSLLPNEDASHGFDNVTLGTLSPTLLDRYISAAQKISRLAVGSSRMQPQCDVIRIRPDLTQEEHVEGLPIGTRGGALVRYTFPQDGEYEIEIRLARDRNEMVEGLGGPHQVELLLDRQRLNVFAVAPPTDREDHSRVDEHLKIRVPVPAGPHNLGVTFIEDNSALLETKRQPFQAHFNMHRHPRIAPAVFQISITGPYESRGAGDTPSRARIFECRPMNASEEEDCARRILSSLTRRAYRRPISNDDLDRLLGFYREGRQEKDFDAGIENALTAILVSPEFLFRIELKPDDASPVTAHRIRDIELATRLSFFLWSSIPDDALFDAAVKGELQQPEMLNTQVRRMLADPRSISLVKNFAGQWLYLNNLDSIVPDLRVFPDFDDNLRQAFRQETELFVESVLREDRSVLDLIDADYTFLNERLAKHYGVPNVFGSRFRRVSLDDASNRGGLLRHGSILTVTSYATRTSPVIRGKWILENFLGTPPPPPPPNVPVLEDTMVLASLPMRERLQQHRVNPVCASCHNSIDPSGFALENFDAVGRWRDFQDGARIDVSGGLPDGSTCTGVAGLEKALLERPELFVTTLSEKLLTFALGRGIEYYDAPAVRKIVRDAQAENFRFSSLILGIVKSVPFQMRKPE
jgi:hypothetical protein